MENPGTSPLAAWPPPLHPLTERQRDQLSVLGHLSTVVAHEIRNPLLIIKAALRTLRISPMGPDQRAAVSDIDAEVERLKHLVTEVLDFGRPLHFDYAPTDLNALCATAAAAATADKPDPAVHLALDEGLSPVITDPERLRAVLVNLLTNARDAVRERGAAPAEDGQEEPAIELRTAALPEDRVAITVRDRGVGIRPADLERVFDAYFTTKRTGTGLGLSIAKSLIEGLEGSLAVQSEYGVGTEVRVELPGQPRPPSVVSLCAQAAQCEFIVTSLKQARQRPAENGPADGQRPASSRGLAVELEACPHHEGR